MIKYVKEIDDELTPETYCDEFRMQQLMAKIYPPKPNKLRAIMVKLGFTQCDQATTMHRQEDEAVVTIDWFDKGRCRTYWIGKLQIAPALIDRIYDVLEAQTTD